MQAFSLMYHDVVPSGEFASSGISGADADVYKLERSAFVKHLDAIAQVGQVRSCLDNWQAGSKPPVFLTFDDGGSCSPWIGEELARRGWRGHFFITTDWIGKPGFVTASDLCEMHAAGHVIGTHSASHPLRISALPENEIHREWRTSVQVLADILGELVPVGSVPGGYYSRAVGDSAAKAGVKMLFISEPTANCQQLGETTLLGRYFIQQHMDAPTAASFAGGPGAARLKQAAVWKMKKAAKKLGGGLYINARVAWFNRKARP